MISLPRQAWDKHRKLPKKNTLFSRAGSTYHLDRPWDFNLFKPGADPGKKMASLVRHFILNMIVLPRQALDKHREKLKKRVPVFLIATGPSVISVVPYVGRVMIGKETPLLRHLYIECTILPRQARDKHREASKKEWRFFRGKSRTELDDCAGGLSARQQTKAPHTMMQHTILSFSQDTVDYY